MAQSLFWVVTAVLTGLLIGSFLNVVIFRLPRECMSIVRPGSHCPGCLHPIAWYDNIPVLSWLLLGGKCRHCRASISIRYPFVELLTASFFLWAALRHPAGSDGAVVFVLIEAYLASALIASTFIDIDLQILPDEITLSGVVLGLGVSAFFPEWHHQVGSELPKGAWENVHYAGLVAGALGALVGGGLIYAIGVLGRLLFRKEAMGFGDVKYLAFLGAFLGWKGILLVVVLACLFGSVYGIGRFLLVRRMGYVPFGPFLSAGAVLMIFLPAPVEAAGRWYLDLVTPSVGG